jgi:hypothetical protein
MGKKEDCKSPRKQADPTYVWETCPSMRIFFDYSTSVEGFIIQALGLWSSISNFLMKIFPAYTIKKYRFTYSLFPGCINWRISNIINIRLLNLKSVPWLSS